MLAKYDNACLEHDIYLYSSFRIEITDPRLELLVNASQKVGGLVYFNVPCFNTINSVFIDSIVEDNTFYNSTLIRLLDALDYNGSLLTMSKKRVDKSLSMLQKRIELEIYELERRLTLPSTYSSRIGIKYSHSALLEGCARFIDISKDNFEKIKDNGYLLLSTKFKTMVRLFGIKVESETYIITNNEIIESLKKLQQLNKQLLEKVERERKTTWFFVQKMYKDF